MLRLKKKKTLDFSKINFDSTTLTNKTWQYCQCTIVQNLLQSGYSKSKRNQIKLILKLTFYLSDKKKTWTIKGLYHTINSIGFYRWISVCTNTRRKRAKWSDLLFSLVKISNEFLFTFFSSIDSTAILRDWHTKSKQLPWV